MAKKKSTTGSAAGTQATGKSATAKKAAQSTPGPPATRDELRAQVIRDIVAIAENLSDDSLELLLEQAQVVEYKGKIEKFNRDMNVAADRVAAARKKAARPEYIVNVEPTDDGFFIVQMDQTRVFFNRNEMREITRICHAVPNAAAGARRLFRWFESERGDLLVDAGINSERSPYLAELYEVVVTTYKLKGS